MPTGRPSKFKPEYVEQSVKLCKLGATDREIGDFFEVDERTVKRWKVDYPEFAEALKTAKAEADTRVVESLYRRACGYEHDDVHITTFEGEVIETPIVKHYPPDTVACIFWLKNRQPDEWRDVKAVDHTGTINHKHASDLPDATLERIAAGSSERVAEETAVAPKPRGVH